MAKMKKATLEDLLQRVNRDGFISKEVEIEELGMVITIVKQPLRTVAELVARNEGIDGDFVAALDVMQELIYKCCPLMRNEELIKKSGVAEPYDVVSVVLQDNLGAMSKIVEEILAFYGLGNEVERAKKQ